MPRSDDDGRDAIGKYREEIVVGADRSDLRIVLLLVGLCSLIGSMGVVSGVTAQNAVDGASPPSAALLLWLLTAIVLAGAAAWRLFGRRVALFDNRALRVHRAIGLLRVGRRHVYSAPDIRNLRIETRGINERGWKTTERYLVFDYRDRVIVLFPNLSERAAETILVRLLAHFPAGRGEPNAP
jgi:hypothetical protein